MLESITLSFWKDVSIIYLWSHQDQVVAAYNIGQCAAHSVYEKSEVCTFPGLKKFSVSNTYY